MPRLSTLLAFAALTALAVLVAYRAWPVIRMLLG